MRGLDYRTFNVPLVSGLAQKKDPRALDPSDLAIALNVQFDEVGGIQLRKPFAATAEDEILDGGTITDARCIVPNGSERLLFTKDKLYSRNAQASKWVEKGTHLAVKIEERNVFVTGGEQTEIDRAELDGTILYAWSESSTVYVGAIDKTTRSVLMAPTVVYAGDSDVRNRPRLVALATKILLFVNNATSNNLEAISIDPSDVASSVGVAMASVGASVTANYYDACRSGPADEAVIVQAENPSTSYRVTIVDGDLNSIYSASKARTCDGPIAVSSTPSGEEIQVVRADGLNIEGDLLTSSGTDVYTNQAIGTFGTQCYQIAAAHRSVATSGQYRCYVFWSDERTSDGATATFLTKSNWIAPNNTLGTEANFVRRLDIGSRAFDHDGRVYVWTIFGMSAGAYGWGGQLQNASFLYRDDGFLVAKAAMNRGAGFLTAGHLPGITAEGEGVFSCAGTERRVFGELTSSNFSGKCPRECTWTFDSNEARRCVRLGKTLYITGGEILQYDGVSLTEVGFHQWPWYFTLTDINGTGDVETGTYAYKLSFVSSNAQAERDRSASIRVETIVVSAGPDYIEVDDISPLYVTHKTAPACEVWRTLKNPPPDGQQFYLASSNNPSNLTNPNRYLPNAPTSGDLAQMNDELADADLSEFGTHPQDATLPNLAPPAASLILATETRLFLAGVAGEPDSVWYSKQRADGEVAAFHGALVASIPIGGGAITALGLLNGSPVVFRERSAFVLLQDGFDNTGGGQNYLAREIPGGIGAVSQEGVATTEKGLIFKSSKGWYLMNQAYGLEYIGANIVDYDSEAPLAIHSLEESQHQIRILTAARMLVLDTLVGQWAEWTIADGVHAAIFAGTYYYLTDAGPKAEQATYAAADYGWDVELGWLNLGELVGYVRVDQIQLRGEYRAAGSLRIRLARDDWKDGVDTYFQSKVWTPSPTTTGGPLRVQHGPSIPQVQQLKIRLTWTPTTVGESPKLTGLALKVGLDGQMARLPAAQRQ